MAEALINDPRKKLYSALISSPDKDLAGQVKKFSYNKFNSLLDNTDFVEDLFLDISERGIVLDPKNPRSSQDPNEFISAFVQKEIPQAFPAAPKPKAAPVAAPVAVEEEEAYIPPPQPAIGSPEYDKRLQAQYGGMAPTLGATFGGVPAAFETKAQKKQEQISPAFKAQKLAFEDVPIAEEQRKAQRQFAKATKEQQQAALRGGTGFELQQQRADEARESTEKLKDFGSYIGATFDNMIDKAKGAERIFAAKQRALLTFGDRGKKAEQEEKKVKQDIYNYISELDQDFAAKQADYNIEGNLFEALRKGQWDRVPEAFAYNLAQIGVNALGAATTGGYSTFAQVMPDIYKAGVEEIARKTKTTPEQVIANGNDKEVLSYIGGGISGYLDYLSGGILGQTMRSQGAYKFLRDKALDKIGKTKWKQAAASAVALGGTSGIEGATELGQGLIEVATPQVAAADTFKEARENIYKELQKPETQRRLAGEFVGGLAGGGGIAAGGRALGRVLEGDFTYGDVRKATQRPDMDVVQTDNKIQERNKIAQAMEEAVKANPEAEGQIRQQYQKRINEAAPKDEEVLSAYESLSVLPETEEKNAIRENLEGYMAEKGIQAEPTGMDAGLGELMRREPSVIQTVNAEFPAPVAEEAVTEEFTPLEEDEDLAAFGRELEAIEQAAPVAPAEDEVVAEEVPAEQVAPEAAPEVVSAAPVEEVAPEVAPEAPAAPAPKGRKKKEAPVQNPKREDFPESQSNTRTPVTQKLLDYFADAFGIPGFTEDLSKGTYIKWLQNANNTGYEVASKLNAPKQAFDVIAQAEKERSKAAALAPKAETKQAAPVTPAPAAPKKEEGEVQQEPRAAQKIAAISPTNLQVFKGVVTKDPLKPKMQGVYFDKANQKIVATDGMNMVVIDRDVKSDVIIDPKTGQVIKLTFPDYQTVIPTDYTKGVRNVSINDLLGKLDAIIKGDKERTKNAFATITFDGEQVGITPKVLKAGLKALKDLGYETASIEYEAPNKPLLIKTKDGKTLLLTMPAFLGEDEAEGAVSIGEFALEDVGKPKAEPAPAPETKEGKKAEAKEEKGKVATKVEEYEGVFNPDKTGVAGIDELLEDDGYQFFYKGKKVERVLMSPDEYLERVRKGLKTKTDANILEGKTEAIKKAIESGAKINAPFISTVGGKFSQEGRNRAVVARELGEQKIPVFIESDVTFDDKINRGTDLVRQSQEKGNTTKESVLEDIKKSGLHRDGVRFIEENYDAIQEQIGGKPEAAPSFTSEQSSEAATAFDKAKTSKGFDKKYGKGAYKALSDITKNFDAIMDKVSDKIKQDCL